MVEKIRTNSKGFGIIELLIILFVVGLLGLGGWYVWYAKQNTNTAPSDSTAATSSEKTQTAQKKIPDDWQWYVSKDKSVKFAYPKSWGNLVEQTQGESESSYSTNSFIQPLVITKKQDLLIQIRKGFVDYTWYMWDEDADALAAAEDTKHPDDPQVYESPVELGSKQKTEVLVDDGKGGVVYHVLGKGAMNCGARHYFFDVKDRVVHLAASLCDRDGEWQPQTGQQYVDVVETPLKEIYKYIQD